MLLADVKKQLHQSGHKVTPQRLTIIKVVLNSTEHLTPSAIYEKAHQIDKKIGEVTVYRTLNILSELGLVCLLHTGDNTHSYVASPTGHHGHIICSECGKVVNFMNCNLQGLEKRLSSETGFAIKEHHLDFYGKCQECTVNTRKS
jgi:Fur family ferric uptake transcriptional regulator